jgi:hypothetical protein
LSVSGRISLMGSSILRSFLISCNLLGILPFLCLPWGRLITCWAISESPWPRLLTMSFWIYRPFSIPSLPSALVPRIPGILFGGSVGFWVANSISTSLGSSGPVEQFLTSGKPNASRGSSFLPGYFSMIGWILGIFWEEEGKCWMKDTIVSYCWRWISVNLEYLLYIGFNYDLQLTCH